MTENIKRFDHPSPIRDASSNSIILVPVTEDVYADEYDYEEIPAKMLGLNLYQLCASPLLVRDLNLDDIVLADDNEIFVKLEKDKGKYGFRVGLQVHYDDHDELAKYYEVIKRLENLNCDLELYSHHLIGIVANNKWKARKVQKELLKLVDEGLILGVETNRN